MLLTSESCLSGIFIIFAALFVKMTGRFRILSALVLLSVFVSIQAVTTTHMFCCHHSECCAQDCDDHDHDSHSCPICQFFTALYVSSDDTQVAEVCSEIGTLVTMLSQTAPFTYGTSIPGRAPPCC